MRTQSNEREGQLPSILVTLIVLVLIASPLLQWWSGQGSPWYFIYLIWGGLILLIALLNLLRSRNVR